MKRPAIQRCRYATTPKDPDSVQIHRYQGVTLAKKMAAAAEKSYEKGQSSPVSVITKVLSKAVRAKKPKTRYAAGYMAKPTIFLRKILSDRWFDKLILSAT